ncbi:MAG TPA: hypothetical protein DDX19_26245 [Rhodopirellula baltica]|nr:hypothetical protein [Rhodopirellula baltica]
MDFQVRRPTRVEQLSPLFRQASLQRQAIPFATSLAIASGCSTNSPRHETVEDNCSPLNDRING